MNFSKKGLEQKQSKLQSNTAKISKKTNIFIYRIFLVALVSLMIIGSVSVFGVVNGLIDNAPSIDSIEVVPTGYATMVYNSDGQLIQRLVGSDANREYATLDQIPEIFQKAVIAIEDERFYQHNGIDVRGMLRALFVGLSKGNFSEGASTITQQLLKNQVFEGGNESNFIASLKRKVQEQYLAVQLENRISKDKILEYYLNTINLGNNTLGVQAAAQRYFDKKVEELTLSEVTVLAGITQNPTTYNPITNPDKNAKRRKEVLDTMLELGDITQEEYDTTINDDVYDQIAKVNESYVSEYNSYFVDEVINQVIEDLTEKLGYTPSQASNLVYTGGLRIYTTQDAKIQAIADSVFQDESYYPSDSEWLLEYRLSVEDASGKQTHYNESHLKKYFNNQDEANTSSKQFDLYFKKQENATPYIEEYKQSIVNQGYTVVAETISFKPQPQISFTLTDQHTGEVKAIVGGRGQKVGNRTLNRATTSLRSPGSTFKILSTYLPALDTNGMTLATVFDDSKYFYPDKPTREVNNTNSSKFGGLTTIRSAIKGSVNVVAVKALAEVTPQVGLDYLKKLGFTNVSESDLSTSMALGGVGGVTNLEVNSAYAAIANGGIYNEPIFYTKITDQNGNVIIDNTSTSKQVMKESTAWLLTDAMKDVVSAGGTGASIKFTSTAMPIAGKTGTSSNIYDLWFAGYTPYYTATIWGGYDYSKAQSNSSYHKKMWKDIMEAIHKNLTVVDFQKPDSIVSANICTKSGKLAVEGVCDHALGGSTVRTEYFAKGTVPTEKCDVHTKLSLCTESNLLATNTCPSTKDVIYLLKTETNPTEDTPYIMPEGLDQRKCTIHAGHPVNNGTEDDPSYNPNVSGTPSITPSPEGNSSNNWLDNLFGRGNTSTASND